VTDTVPVATFGQKPGRRGGGCRGRCLPGAIGNSDLAGFNSKINGIIFKIT
jgi:hypothetical protein